VTATFADGASGSNRCNFQNGTFTTERTLEISGTPAAGEYYWETNGTTVRVKGPGDASGLTAGGITFVASESGFSLGEWVPIGRISYTSGTDWDATVLDDRPHFSLAMNVVAGTGLTSVDSGITRTTSVDSAITMMLGVAQTSTAKKTFSPSATDAGLAVTCAALPSSPANNDLVCDSGDSNKLKRYIGGVWTEVGGGGGDMVLASAQTSTAKKTFNPTASAAGMALQCTTLPSSPVNGDMACDSADSNRIKVYRDSAWRPVDGPVCDTTYDFTTFGFDWSNLGNQVVSTTNPVVRPWTNTCWRTIKRVFFRVGAAGSASEATRFGFYTPDCQTQLSTSDAYSGTGIGNQGAVFGTAVVVAPGNYCIMFGSNSTTLTAIYNNMTTGSSELITGVNQTTIKMGVCGNAMVNSGASGALPSSCGTISSSGSFRLYNFVGIPD